MTAKVFDMLLAVPKYGRVKANRVLNQCRISPAKTIGGLSERQRGELVTPAAPLAPPSPVSDSAEPLAAKVFVITGPSGVGKGTLIRSCCERLPEPRALDLGDHPAPARG